MPLFTRNKPTLPPTPEVKKEAAETPSGQGNGGRPIGGPPPRQEPTTAPVRATTPPRSFAPAEKRPEVTTTAPLRPFPNRGSATPSASQQTLEISSDDSSGLKPAATGLTRQTSKLPFARPASVANPEGDNYAEISLNAFRLIMKAARNQNIAAKEEISALIKEYGEYNPSGFQIVWLADKLNKTPSRLQAEISAEHDWIPLQTTAFIEISDSNIPVGLRQELRANGFIPVLAEESRANREQCASGYITVMAEHGLVEGMVLSICRKHGLNFLFCRCLVIEITLLQQLFSES